PPQPPIAIESLTTQVPNTEAVSSIVQRFFDMEQFVKQLKETDFSSANNVELKKELSELNYKEVIDESVKAHVVKEVKNFLPYESLCSKRSKELSTTGSPKGTIEVAKSLSELELKNILYEKMLKSGSSCSHKTHEELLNALTCDDDKDEDPYAGSNQGKPPSKPSKSGKSRSINDVEETVFKMGSDDVDQTFDKKADDSEQFDANTEQPSLAVAANPKRQKHDWYKKSPSPEPRDLDWNTVKTIDDAQEQL
ncbi:hypothetical protein Tco_1494822, partial [Tanacetum coccineum]